MGTARIVTLATLSMANEQWAEIPYCAEHLKAVASSYRLNPIRTTLFETA